MAIRQVGTFPDTRRGAQEKITTRLRELLHRYRNDPMFSGNRRFWNDVYNALREDEMLLDTPSFDYSGGVIEVPAVKILDANGNPIDYDTSQILEQTTPYVDMIWDDPATLDPGDYPKEVQNIRAEDVIFTQAQAATASAYVVWRFDSSEGAASNTGYPELKEDAGTWSQVGYSQVNYFRDFPTADLVQYFIGFIVPGYRPTFNDPGMPQHPNL